MSANWSRARHITGISDVAKPPLHTRAGLCMSIFAIKSHSGTPTKDIVFYSGIFVAILQVSIACIPYAVYGQWSVLMITTSDTLLAFISGALPKWKAEKWQCHHMARDVILVRGNGVQHVIR